MNYLMDPRAAQRQSPVSNPAIQKNRLKANSSDALWDCSGVCVLRTQKNLSYRLPRIRCNGQQGKSSARRETHGAQKRKSRCPVRQHWTAAKHESLEIPCSRRTSDGVNLGDLQAEIKSFFRAEAGLVRLNDATAGKGLPMCFSETRQRMGGTLRHPIASSENVGHWRSGKFVRATEHGYKAAPFGTADKEGRSHGDSL